MDIFTLFGRIAINNSDAISAIDDTSNRASKLSAVFGKVGSAAVAVGKVMAKGLAVGAAGVAALTTNSVKQYAEYEQLLGGVQTLFKESSDTVMQYANDAYKSAGLSANEYMATVTSFSASLLQSLGGDTAAAADVAHMALTDMADNANKMGTSMEMIQNAYQGFAKQNYTMLDNLKLGYGGTKTEMQRLLKDAQKLTGVKYDIRNLDDVYKAINAIQTEMGITGTTAEEASETISGSWSAMSSAWTNLVVGIADDSQDLNRLIDNFADSAVTAFTNISKRVPSIVAGISKLIDGIAPQIPGLIQNLLPVVVDGAVSLIAGLASVIPGLMQTLFDMIPGILQKVGQAISDIWTGTVLPAIKDLFKAVFGVEMPEWSDIASEISSGWNDTIWPSIQDFFKTNFDITLPDWTAVTDSIDTVVAKTEELATSIGEWVTSGQAAEDAQNMLNTAIDKVTKIVQTASDKLKEFIGWLTGGSTEAGIFVGVLTGVVTWMTLFAISMGVKSLIEGVTAAITAAKEGFKLFNAVLFGNPILLVVAAIAGLIGYLVYLYNTNEDVRNAIDTAWAAIKSIFETCCAAVVELIQGVIDAWEKWFPTEKTVTVHYSSSGEVHGGGEGKSFGDAGESSGGEVDGTHAKGLNFVPKDNYLARLHYGEAVLTRSEADVWRNGGDGGNIKQVQQLTASVQQLVDDLPDMLVNAFASMKFDVNNRELARLVKAVN